MPHRATFSCALFSLASSPLADSDRKVGDPLGLAGKPSPQRVREMVEEIRLLKKKELQELFPDCQILTEKILGILPKSYIAVRKV